MTRSDENNTPGWRVQFRLGSLLALVGAFAVLLAMGHWWGWRFLWGLCSIVILGGTGGVIFLPALVFVLARSARGRGWIGTVFLAAGSLLIIHVIALWASVEFTLRQPWVLDVNPYDHLVSENLNWTLPAAVMGMCVALSLRRKIPPSNLYWVGVSLTACGCLALAWFGHYFFSTLMGSTLAKNVWWL